MNRRRIIKTVLHVAVPVLLLGLLFKLIDLHDSVRLKDGSAITGRVVSPDKTEQLGAQVEVVDRSGVPHEIAAEDLAEPARTAVQYGFLSSIRDVVDPLAAGIGFLLMGLLPLTTGYRWQLLMRVQGVNLGFWQCVRLTLLGFFLDNFIPGSTGGDVAKAYYAARRAHRKAEAAVSVFVDRFVGLFALATLSGIAVVVSLGRPEVAQAGWVVLIFLGGVFLASLVFFSRRIRKVLRFDAIIARLPFQRIVQRCDEAVFLYRYHKMAVVWAIGLSVLTQASAVVSMWLIGRGMGVRGSEGVLGLYPYFVYFPVIMMVSAIPVSPGGVGWREGTFAFFLSLAGVPAGMGAALAVVYRVTRMIWSLPGALFLWGSRHVSAAEMERALETDAPAPDGSTPDS